MRILNTLLLSFLILGSLEMKAQVNTPEEFVTYLKSAESGSAEDQVVVGNCYMNGSGTSRDVEKAYRWYTLAANQDYPAGYYNLAYCYDRGFGVPKNPKRAFKLYRLSAIKGFAMGVFLLGSCYEKGEGVEKDRVKALEYYRMASTNEETRSLANYKIGEYFENGFGGLVCNMDSALAYYHIYEESKGIYYILDDPIRRFAEIGYAKAMFMMGMRDPKSKDAMQWFADASLRGDGDAAYQLAQIYDYGYVKKVNSEKAFELYKFAAEHDCTEAMFELATIYHTGKFIGTPDYERAKKWYQKAADAGITYAQKCVEQMDDLINEQHQQQTGKQ